MSMDYIKLLRLSTLQGQISCGCISRMRCNASIVLTQKRGCGGKAIFSFSFFLFFFGKRQESIAFRDAIGPTRTRGGWYMQKSLCNPLSGCGFVVQKWWRAPDRRIRLAMARIDSSIHLEGTMNRQRPVPNSFSGHHHSSPELDTKY
jgi:hypothetical protein